MQRPVMDPMSMLHDLDGTRGSHALRDRFRSGFGRTWRIFRAIGRVLFSQPFHVRGRNPEDARPLAVSWMKALGYRLLFAPIFIALAASALVYRGTHPIRLHSDKLPDVPGTFYETVEFNGLDGHPLMAWYVPVIDAKRVLEKKNDVFRGQQPAVVLVHDFNQTPSQMAPLIEPLHDQGFAVMVVGLRGVGRGRVAAQTFGLNEAVDVRGALAELRKRPQVDANRIALVGVGSGANAAVIVAGQDPGVCALALVNPCETAERAIADRVGPESHGFRWMQKPSKWVFEVAYHVDADDLQLARFRDVLTTRPTLSLTRDAGDELDDEAVEAVRAFCEAHLPKPKGKPQSFATTLDK
jgi:hypothetical protein